MQTLLATLSHNSEMEGRDSLQLDEIKQLNLGRFYELDGSQTHDAK